ncbi:MAG: DNA-3-methyladenine glycosylase I [Pseudomonadota bacterium]
MRCEWCGDDPQYIAYHDDEWGRPCFERTALFECLNLEGQQAGLSWITVLRKRDHYRKVFADFEPERVARFTAKKVEKLVLDPGIIRHRGKIEAIITNAKALLALEKTDGDFATWIWTFVDGEPQRNACRSMADVPAVTPTSERMSKTLKKRGFRFVGPTTCYAFMQAVGMVNDHMVGCDCYEDCG